MKIQKVESVAGKMLIALDKGTKRECGSAHRVAIVGEKNDQKVWLIEYRGKLAGVRNTWDECTQFFRDKGCIVRIHDADVEPTDDASNTPHAISSTTRSRAPRPSPPRDHASAM